MLLVGGFIEIEKFRHAKDSTNHGTHRLLKGGPVRSLLLRKLYEAIKGFRINRSAKSAQQQFFEAGVNLFCFRSGCFGGVCRFSKRKLDIIHAKEKTFGLVTLTNTFNF